MCGTPGRKVGKVREAKGNIWQFLPAPIVVPTNIGWKKDGTNVMGKGLARQAAERYPSLPLLLGAYCKERRFYATTWPVEVYSHVTGEIQLLLCFPAKPLTPGAPQFSWNGKASLALVKKSLATLVLLASTDKRLIKEESIYLPLVGCGEGGLGEEIVLPLLQEALSDRFVLVWHSSAGVKRPTPVPFHWKGPSI